MEEIGSLAELTGLKSIGFIDCDSITDISVINELPSLTRLVLPANTSQEMFSDIIDNQKSLQVLDLFNCEDITDISPLEGYTGLKALSVDTVHTDFRSLYQMKELELLVLGKDYFKDSLFIAELQDSLPDTKIVPGGGFCMGSGWILLIFPFLFILIQIRKVSKK